MNPPHRFAAFLFITLWIVLVGSGFAILIEYENTPGEAFAAPREWPVESRIERAPGTPTLVLFAHPKCPCTRATISELARIMRPALGLVHAVVLFIQPGGFSEQWAESDLWRRASSIPGVQVAQDHDGREARLYGAATSGQVVLYDAEGRLRFSGGITASRGHEGDNAGRDAIVTLLTSGSADRSETFVFGCPLAGDDLLCTEESCQRH